MRSFFSLAISLAINGLFFVGFWYSVVRATPQTYGYSNVAGHTMIEMLSASVEAPPPTTIEEQVAEVVEEPEPEPVVEPEPEPEPEPIVEPEPEPVVKAEPEPVKKIVKKEPPKKEKPKKKVVKKEPPKEKPKKKVVKKEPVKDKPKKQVTEKKPSKAKATPEQAKPTDAKEISDVANSAPAGNPSPNNKPSNQAASAGGSPLADAYKSELRNLIARNKRYPSKARKMRKEGTVEVSFSIAKGGGISNIRVSRSSGNRDLDKAAIGAVRRVGKFKPRPDNVAENMSVSLNFQIK